MGTGKLKQLMRALVLSQFNCFPLVWMFFDRTLNRKVNHVHERVLCNAYKDCKNDFGSLPGQPNSISIHVRNLKLLMTEIFRAKFYLNPPFMKYSCIERSVTYNLRHGNDT